MPRRERTSTPPTGAPTPLARNRNFRLLWVGQILSDLGSQFGVLAYPLLILELTHSAAIAGAVATVASLAAFAVRLPAGALSDRIDRRRAMVVADGVRAGVLALLGVGVLTHHVNWEVVLAAAVVDRLGDTIFTPASMAALPAIVHSDQLETAWAATEGRQYAASLAGPALGGALFSLARSLPFFGDGLSYGVSTLTSAMMRGEFVPPARERSHGLWREALEGLEAIWRDRLLRSVVAVAPLINFAFNGMIFGITLSLRVHGVGAATIGLVQAGIMVGGLVGAVIAPRLQGRVSLRALVVTIAAVGTGLFAVAALVIPSTLVALPIAATVLLAPAANAALFAALFRRTPDELRGRVSNSILQVATGLAAFSPVVAGLLIEHASSHWALGVFATALGLSAIIAWASPGLREDAAGEVLPAEGGGAKHGLVLDHLSIQCSNPAASAAFYDAVLAPVGVARIMEFGPTVGYGADGKPDFWIGPFDSGDGFRESHIAFAAPDRAAVRSFFDAAVAAGAEVLHEPRAWTEYHENYYGAFVRDPDGNNVEAVCHIAEG
ncbi:MAG TPA: MFS transporter [Acidimicrobiales bacterium]|nr:MFS transporter [Acidimicrobiales bacterium]